MKLENIINEWDKDCKIDYENLVSETVKTPELHNKYYKIYLVESKLLRDMQQKLDKLSYDKWMYYSGKMDKEDLESRGWEQCSLKFLKGDIQKVMDSDDELATLKNNIAFQSDKVKFVNDIIGVINRRTFTIGHAIDLKKMELGIA